ncbi:hypothetical protein SAMN03159300_1011151 [Janthinobacterium sp. 344]|nr:hypothetical protein SAMN03159349_01150 [Janthinobacterium sp. 551a]SFA99865.1 hypothetical protein SAMN03159300_1011151 [Janthinobacterium sp. 344]
MVVIIWLGEIRPQRWSYASAVPDSTMLAIPARILPYGLARVALSWLTPQPSWPEKLPPSVRWSVNFHQLNEGSRYGAGYCVCTNG